MRRNCPKVVGSVCVVGVFVCVVGVVGAVGIFVDIVNVVG